MAVAFLLIVNLFVFYVFFFFVCLLPNDVKIKINSILMLSSGFAVWSDDFSESNICSLGVGQKVHFLVSRIQ